MSKTVQRRCLSGVDAAFLYLERKELPLHIAGVLIFEEPPPFDEFIANLDSRLPLIPRYLQVAVPAPFNVGHPVWEPARRFDIRNHVFQAHLEPPGGRRELEALASRILSEPLDRSKPLWDIQVVDGLQGGQGALIVRVHHCMADGVSGVALLRAILDATPDAPRATGKPRPRRRPKPAEYSLQDAFRNAIQGTLENLIASETVLLDFAESLVGKSKGDSLAGLVGVLPELAAPVERLPFNKPCQAGRKFCWAEMDLAAFQAIRAALGGTLNDVILTIVTRAIARYTKLHRESVMGRFVRIVCPVNTRSGEQGQSLGNRITFMPVVLPLGVADPAEHLNAVAIRTAIMKNARAADLVALLATWIGASPPLLQKLFWSGITLASLPVPLFNTICTNIAGSPVPLYSCGKRMLAGYPHVPTGYELGVNIAVMSYAGKFCFGLTADAHACSDVERLRDLLDVAFRELCKRAGIKRAGIKKPRPRPRPRQAPVAIPEVPKALQPEALPQTLAEPAIAVAAAQGD